MQPSSSSRNRQGGNLNGLGLHPASVLVQAQENIVQKSVSKIAVGSPDQSKLRLFQPLGPRPLWRAQSQQRRKFLGARPACAGTNDQQCESVEGFGSGNIGSRS